MTNKTKKRVYIRKCGGCGKKQNQKDLIRTNYSPNGWYCEECFEGDPNRIGDDCLATALEVDVL